MSGPSASKTISWFLFDVAITSSYILSTFFPTSISISQQRLKQYRMKLAEQLVGSYNSRKPVVRPSSNTESVPSVVPPPPPVCGPSQQSHTAHQPSRLWKRKRCIYCTERRNPPGRKDTPVYCKDCSDKPPLCHVANRDYFTL